MKATIDTIEQAVLLIGKRPASVTCAGHDAPMTLLRVTSCGIHRDGRAWIGFDHRHNDNGREVVAPAAVFFLPVIIESLAPVVGAEDGEHARNDYPLPVATAEPGPGGTHDGPGRASIEETA